MLGKIKSQQFRVFNITCAALSARTEENKALLVLLLLSLGNSMSIAPT